MAPWTAIHAQVEAARALQLVRVVTRLRSGWVVMAEKQVLPGYCLLLPDPVVSHLNALALEGRTQFLRDMSLIGDALLKLTGALRINYEMLGNLEPALHAHVIPRYKSEPEELGVKPIWSYDWNAAPNFDLVQHGPLLKKLQQELYQ